MVKAMLFNNNETVMVDLPIEDFITLQTPKYTNIGTITFTDVNGVSYVDMPIYKKLDNI